MRRVLVRELRPYSLAGLVDMMGTDEERALEVAKALMHRGVMVRRRSNGDDDETPAADLEGAAVDEVYQFRYVGLAMVGELVFVAYPKYFRDREPTADELRQVFRAIRRQRGASWLPTPSEDGFMGGDRLALMLELLERYGEYGEYTNYVEAMESCGPGVIDWNRTVGMRTPLIVDGRPIYVEYDTRKTKRDESDFVTRLHRSVLTECSEELGECGLSDILALDEVWLTDERVDDLADVDALEWRLSRERGVQFVTWKLEVLELVERYVLRRESPAERDEVQCLGTTSFYHVWETACKVAFGDAIDRRLGALGVELAPAWRSRSAETLLGIIPRPVWELPSRGATTKDETDTLIPDTVAIELREDGGRAFCIYDAKYYVPTIEGGHIKGQPGVESVAKQFLYQRAYRDFVLDHGFAEVRSAFLVPTCGEEAQLLGSVSFAEVMPEEVAPFSNKIDMWMVPASLVFDAYLGDSRLSAAFLLS